MSNFAKRLAARVLGRDRPRAPATDPTDVFIVCYPRSGSTWVRFLLANLLRAPTGEPVDFHTLPETAPDLELPDHWPGIAAARPPRLLKTHGLPQQRFRRVIYVLRDGRDVMVSQYHYQRGLGRFGGTFLEFLDGGAAARWARHVSAWLDAAVGRDLLLVRYEDLLADAADVLRRMAAFAALPAEPAHVAWAVEHSSFEAMRRLQAARGRPRNAVAGFEHVRQGTGGQWRTWFKAAHADAFSKVAGAALRRCGYGNEDA